MTQPLRMDPSLQDSPGRWAKGPDLLEAASRYRWWVAGFTLLAGLVGFTVSALQPPVYEAEARLLLNDPRTVGIFEQHDPTGGDRFIRNEAEAANSPQVIERAVELLEDQLTYDQLDERAEARASVDVDVLTIRARARTAEGAALLANTVADAYQELARQDVQASAEEAIGELAQSTAELQATVDRAEAALERRPGNSALQAERDVAVAQLITLDGRARQMAVDAALFGSGVKRFQEARPPEDPAEPQPVRSGLFALVAGLLASTGVAWWRAERSQIADRRQDAAPILGAPLLGQIPDFKDSGVDGVVPTLTAPHSGVAEAYQFIVASLEHALQHSGGTRVAITSARTADGKSVTSLNLAIAAAREGRRVALVDADERAAGLTRLTGVAAVPGLTDLGQHSVPFEGCCSRLSTVDGELTFVPTGRHPTDPARFFRTPAFRTGMARITDQVDLVIVDTPPLLAVADTSAIAGQVDAIVLVVARGTPISALEEVRERLDFVGTPVLGYIFNRASPRSSYGYGYTYGSRYEDQDHVSPEGVGALSPNGHPPGTAQGDVARRGKGQGTPPAAHASRSTGIRRAL